MQERHQVVQQCRMIRERKLLGVGFQKEVERVNDRHLGDEVDFDDQLLSSLGEHQPSDIIAVRILLPVHVMTGRLDPQRVTQHGSTSMRGRSEPHEVWPEFGRVVVLIFSTVMQRDADSHGGTPVRGNLEAESWGQRCADRPPILTTALD